MTVPVHALQLGSLVVGVLSVVLLLVVVGLPVAGMWQAFRKADRPGWAAVVPVLNLYVLVQLAGRPAWWVLLLLVPGVNLVVWFLVLYDVARAFDGGLVDAVGLYVLAFVFWPAIGFGSATYRGPPR
ncbi:MAG: DUF5684 domain-containing protein [Halobacteriales archaeon]